MREILKACAVTLRISEELDRMSNDAVSTEIKDEAIKVNKSFNRTQTLMNMASIVWLVATLSMVNSDTNMNRIIACISAFLMIICMPLLGIVINDKYDKKLTDLKRQIALENNKNRG